MQTVPYRNTYGSIETNGLVNGADYHYSKKDHPTKPHVDWTEKGLRITRLRLLTDSYCPFWDVSYCDGKLDGYDVVVHLPFSQLPKRDYKKTIIAYAKQDKVYAKGLGILDVISTLR